MDKSAFEIWFPYHQGNYYSGNFGNFDSDFRLHEKHGALGQFLLEPYVGNSFRFRKFSQIGQARNFQAKVLINAKQRVYAGLGAKITKYKAKMEQYKKAFDQKRQHVVEASAKQQKKYREKAIELAERNKKMRISLSKWQPELKKRKKKLANLKIHYSKSNHTYWH